MIRHAETPDAEHHYNFNGQIHPERYALHVGTPISYEGDSLKMVVWLVRGHVAVDVVAREEWSSVIDLKNVVMSIAESVVNALGFALAAAFRTDIVSFRGPSGNLEVFNTAFDGLRSVMATCCHQMRSSTLTRSGQRQRSTRPYELH